MYRTNLYKNERKKIRINVKVYRFDLWNFTKKEQFKSFRLRSNFFFLEKEKKLKIRYWKNLRVSSSSAAKFEIRYIHTPEILNYKLDRVNV